MKDGWWAEPEWSNPVREKLAACGAQTGISARAVIHQPEKVSIGRGCRIDDFVHILGGEGIVIGDRVHISPFVSIEGGGSLEIGSYSGIAAGVRIVTGSEDLTHGWFTNPCVPQEYRNPKRGRVKIGKHCLVFTGTILLPGSDIADGAAVGSGVLHRGRVPAWSIRPDSVNLWNRHGRAELEAQEKNVIERYGF